jgi:hypothetical protein
MISHISTIVQISMCVMVAIARLWTMACDGNVIIACEGNVTVDHDMLR